ncbi:unnamed protein product [Leptidea sinapis]|uniref:Uncharacterized protein n=1 Tax=Leptidea sinapis TaxID=189913 RepID=A0A5E4QMD4_9NEOP|nr:unnamed protein product [Leptidea sinapis]
MSRRFLITSANYLDPYMHRQKDVRIWALGRTGAHNTPYRYRVWRLWRLFPRSANPEHQHGHLGLHSPRHDVVLIISFDQMYMYSYSYNRYQYATRSLLCTSHMTLEEELYFAGSGYEYMEHVLENYKIFYGLANRSEIVDCSKYLPKWWGKFICIRNTHRFVGVQNGGSLFSGNYLVGIGCFEIRYNQDRIFVYTDLRYYVNILHKFADISPGQYYEYAYPQWGITLGLLYDGGSNLPYIPVWQITKDVGLQH